MYNDTLNGSTEKRSAELPDAVGPIVQLQEKLYVPVKEYPDVSTFFGESVFWLIACVIPSQCGFMFASFLDPRILLRCKV